ncbi:hypothetical protein CKAH01_05966, partial [Colletotrichum kahawae]
LCRLSKPDIVTAVLGITGSGKSTFISTLTDLEVDVGDSLASQTTEISIYNCELKNGQRVYLVDTPGFDDASRADVDVLQEQAFLFTQLYKMKAALAGIVYLHPIQKNRISGSTARNFRMLEQMCGLEALDRVVLVTTMWNQIDPGTPQHENACQRQQELVDDSRFWGNMCRRGGRAMQFDGSKRTASQVVDTLLNSYAEKGPAVFKIQHEVVDEGLDIRASSAASELTRDLARIREQFQKEIGQLWDQYRQAEREKDYDRASIIAQERYALEEGLKDGIAANDQLQTSFDDICAQKETRFADVLRQNSQEYESLSQELRRAEHRLQSLEEERQESMAIYESEREWMLSRPKAPSLPPGYDESFENSFRQDQENIQQRTTYIHKSLKSKKRRRVMIQNIIPMLQILRGVGCVVGGAVSLIPPLTAAGATLVVTGTSGLNFSTRKKEKKDPQECNSD